MHFNEIDSSSLPEVGGKGANLGEMSKAGFPVPQGFCITTSAYLDFLATSPEMERLFDLLGSLQADQLEEISKLGKQVRDHLQSLTVPAGVQAAIIDAWEKTGKEKAYAVRSSATAEDLSAASFAGQQDTYLNVTGEVQLLQAVQKCWASLFTDRAVTYRARNGFDHRSVLLSVVVQQMVFPDVSGIMFTADPLSGHRGTVSIDAGFGLGEALVSGIVTADLYQVRKGRIIKKQIAAKKMATYAAPEGGAVPRKLPPELQSQPALSDDRILELAGLGQRIEKHYGSEQDIEWCLAGNKFFIVQSRPITSLYPVPKVDDDKFHVFYSFAHVQMMMDAMKPLAISLWQSMFPFGKESLRSSSIIILEAGGRIFFDTTVFLYWKPIRRYISWSINIFDDLMGDAITKVMASDAFQEGAKSYRGAGRQMFRLFKPILPVYAKMIPSLIKSIVFRNPSRSFERAMASLKQVLYYCERSIRQVSGAEQVKVIKENMSRAIYLLGDSFSYAPLGFIALPVASRLAKRWLGEDLDMDTLNKSLPGNITSELGLMIGDLADTARQYPVAADYLEKAGDNTFYQGLVKVKGGAEFKTKLDQFMERYGMRCPGEIDISNVRWQEAPTLIVPAILSHMKSNVPGEHRVKFRQGQKEANEYVQFILARTRKTFGGALKTRLLSRFISLYRNTAGLREFPKYALVRLLGIYRQAILEQAQSLREKKILQKEKDVFYLSLDELLDLLENRFAGDVEALITSRQRAFEQYQRLTPPRVMTSEGEVFTGVRSGVQAPEGALAGTPVSAGVAEGYVRVIFRPEEAKLNKGDVLVAPFTDPGWTPLFHSAQALVVEVGGMMTHGSVIAREYGIPAVVGIDNVTKTLKDGQYIRVDGTRGFVQVLAEKG
jgi:pyruvate,water dikinase